MEDADIIWEESMSVSFDDVTVDPEIIQNMKRVITLSVVNGIDNSYGLLAKKNLRGALLYGPPGTGKTHLAQAVARDSQANMIAINPSAILAPHVGDSEALIKALFSLATKLSPCVIFVDEADSLFRRRKSSDKSWERSLINEFLQQIEEIHTKKDDAPFILLATNRPADIDDGIL
ncbi:hypothetical protein N7493_000991 [Penicillium malachiteum]|uniref:AAA+ ATPase domain-containing protein n=1 Tax=Penicillium malachiteum TaxID=1324776 RepID=A0AAD6HYJ7_9EURO|nr:hypothetical protein N7493_000991 [Penicillium malachiteum]